MPGPVKAFMDRGEDFIVERELENAGVQDERADRRRLLLSLDKIEREIRRAGPQMENRFAKGYAGGRASGARARYIGDRLMRTATPHRLLDPAAGR